MSKSLVKPLDKVLAALADPTRRDVVERLAARGEATIATLAAGYPMALPTFSHHLDVLEQAGLIARTRVGRQRYVSLLDEALGPVRHWIDRVQPPAVAAPPLPAAVQLADAILAKAAALQRDLAPVMAVVEAALAPAGPPAPARFSPAAVAARRLAALAAGEPELGRELAEACRLYRQLVTQSLAVRGGAPIELLRPATLPLGRLAYSWRARPALRELLFDMAAGQQGA
ncbi:MAG: ArsR family transcriptional regulator [Cyanobacteria bacterium RYN_339]|nr:ArsR family transcriptional regulator [Cyanobacteria bacterium RYN_339]